MSPSREKEKQKTSSIVQLMKSFVSSLDNPSINPSLKAMNGF